MKKVSLALLTLCLLLGGCGGDSAPSNGAAATTTSNLPPVNIANTIASPTDGQQPAPPAMSTSTAQVAGPAPSAADLNKALGLTGDFIIRSAPVDARKLVATAVSGTTEGNANAKVVVVEFSDFQCPACRAAAISDTLPDLKKEFIDTGKIQFVYRPYPLEQIHNKARVAANASLCANEQGKFWPYHDVLFSKQSDWVGGDEGTLFAQYATDLELDGAKFAACYAARKDNSLIDQSLKDGDAAGLNATPYFVINGYAFAGAYPINAFRQIIAAAEQGQ